MKNRGERVSEELKPVDGPRTVSVRLPEALARRLQQVVLHAPPGPRGGRLSQHKVLVQMVEAGVTAFETTRKAKP